MEYENVTIIYRLLLYCLTIKVYECTQPLPVWWFISLANIWDRKLNHNNVIDIACMYIILKPGQIQNSLPLNNIEVKERSYAQLVDESYATMLCSRRGHFVYIHNVVWQSASTL